MKNLESKSFFEHAIGPERTREQKPILSKFEKGFELTTNEAQVILSNYEDVQRFLEDKYVESGNHFTRTILGMGIKLSLPKDDWKSYEKRIERVREGYPHAIPPERPQNYQPISQTALAFA
tara:strand:- start:26 stop:388 length:363 start_codon:yes stop_codon:yes gene_type:complete